MAYSVYYDHINYPFGYRPPTRPIKLSEATLDEIKAHYKESVKTRMAFDDIRPNHYMTHGTFKTDPMMEHYKTFLKDQGVEYICIQIKGER